MMEIKGRQITEKELKKLLNMIFLYEDDIKKDMSSDFYCLFLDIKEVVFKIKLTQNERNILGHWLCGMNSREISKTIKKDFFNTCRSLRKISKKIFEVLNG